MLENCFLMTALKFCTTRCLSHLCKDESFIPESIAGILPTSVLRWRAFLVNSTFNFQMLYSLSIYLYNMSLVRYMLQCGERGNLALLVRFRAVELFTS